MLQAMNYETHPRSKKPITRRSGGKPIPRNEPIDEWRAGGGGVKPSVEKKTTKTVKPSIQDKKEGREETYIEYVTGLGLRDEKNIPDLFK